MGMYQGNSWRKSCSCVCQEHVWESGGVAVLILNLDARLRWMVSWSATSFSRDTAPSTYGNAGFSFCIRIYL